MTLPHILHLVNALEKELGHKLDYYSDESQQRLFAYFLVTGDVKKAIQAWRINEFRELCKKLLKMPWVIVEDK